MIDAKGIEKVIPHRGAMRLVDEIREYNETSGVGIKYVRDDEFWCAGHFPGRPIMPGVLQVEALAQTASCSPLAGFVVTKVSPFCASTHCPSISNPYRSLMYLAISNFLSKSIVRKAFCSPAAKQGSAA